jgi:hypothetical protein
MAQLNQLAEPLRGNGEENRSSWGQIAADLDGDDLRCIFWLKRDAGFVR